VGLPVAPRLIGTARQEMEDPIGGRSCLGVRDRRSVLEVDLDIGETGLLELSPGVT